MRALVTGATGFIGSHLVEGLIREGFETSCLVRKTSSLSYLEGLKVSLVRGDCADRSSLFRAVGGFDYVFHVAGVTKAQSDKEFFDANVTGTRNVADAVLEQNRKIKRFFYLSSLAAAGPSTNGALIHEGIDARPVSVYGTTKYEGEKIALSIKGEVPVTIIRPPAVYGPRDRDLLVFFKMVKAGIVPYWGRSFYSFVYVDDLVSAIVLSALKPEGEGQVFFVSDGMVYSTDQVIDALAGALGRRPLRLRIPKWALPFFARVSRVAGGAAIINSDKIREIQYDHWTCDSGKANSLLAFTPKVRMTEGARWTADWYRTHHWL